MSNQRYTPEFKQEAVRQITERGYSVAEVSERLGVFSHSLYNWAKNSQALRKTARDQKNTHILYAYPVKTSAQLITGIRSSISRASRG